MTRLELENGATRLHREIVSLRSTLRSPLLNLLTDVEIFHKAVHWPLAYGEFYRTNEISVARQLLQHGFDRAQQMRNAQAPWLSATGLVVRGYVSKIDGSVQPYGLVVPASFRRESARPYRLDVWLHGRDNHLTELKFISDRLRTPGEFAPADAIVLHPYGRYCNAFKFAGEVDVFEAIEHVCRSYPIDERRIAIRGFSMGGAGTWHLAAHHPTFWRLAAPGAGFAETAAYTQALTKQPKPPWYEQALWHLYDATDCALNLFNCPVIAYSGELDKQKQAADIMAKAMATEGLELTHLIGPKTEHKYEPATKLELARQVDDIMRHPPTDAPPVVRFTTWTLRYNEAAWVTVQGLEHHWKRARVEASLLDNDLVEAKTSNVSALALVPRWPGKVPGQPRFVLDGQILVAHANGDPGSFHFRKSGARWKQVRSLDDHSRMRKRPGLQGPIDDAFMDSFLVVHPTGAPFNQAVGAWVARELDHATNEWRAQFRGQARVKDDIAVTPEDIANHNLILWGDPQSNRLLGRIRSKLPLRWDAKTVRLAGKTVSSSQHVPVLIFPNPLNARRYVVLNSGFTFCESGAGSNAQQTPKLPDYAVLDVTVPLADRTTRGVVHAGFFNERWED